MYDSRVEIPAGSIKFGKNEIALSVKGSNRRGLVPRIGNLGIDVIFNGELEALKKPGNMVVSTTGERAAKPAKKGGRK